LIISSYQTYKAVDLSHTSWKLVRSQKADFRYDKPLFSSQPLKAFLLLVNQFI
jgi:hypothetical protein